MEILNAYTETIFISLVIILSFFFNAISRKTKIPSVLLLIGLGVGIKSLMARMDIDLDAYIMTFLELLGVVGLIMIVLEASLDLELKKEKKPLLIKSFFVAILSLGGTALGVGYLFYTYIFQDFFTSMVYAIPLSILSSAIIIPSVASLIDPKREFMIYESTFSDILGIMLFYFVIGSAEAETGTEVATTVSVSILVTVLVSIIVSYLMVILLQGLRTKVKLFFLISVLILLYSTGKLFHLSSLLIIMVFGLVLNNYELFFSGKLSKYIKPNILDEITEDFHMLTMETAFVVRTFFFVIFGMTLDFSGITHLPSVYVAVGVLGITYSLRYLLLKIFVRRNITPQLWIAPRGLITVLLFFSIPIQLASDRFDPAILLMVILASSFIMSGGLMSKGEDIEEMDKLSFTDWEVLDKEIETLKTRNST